MAIVADPVAKARGATTLNQAARLHADLEHELELNANAPPEWRAQAEDALDTLEGTWGADELREKSVDVGHTPRLSRGARQGLEGPRRARSRGAGQDGRQGARKPSPRTTRRLARAGGRAGRGRRRGSRAFEQTGIPGAARSTTAFTLQLLGLMIGLALLYRVLYAADRNAPGWRYLEQGLNTVSTALHSFVAPIDPLRARAAPPPAAPSNVVPLRPRQTAVKAPPRKAAAPTPTP